MDDALPLSGCHCQAVREAARHVSQFYDRALGPSGLRTSQYSILYRLRRTGPRGIQSLAAELRMDRTTLGRNLRPLERDGLVRIAADPADRRGRAVSVTPAGEARLRDAAPRWAEAQARFERSVGMARAAELRRLMAAIVSTPLDQADPGQADHDPTEAP